MSVGMLLFGSETFAQVLGLLALSPGRRWLLAELARAVPASNESVLRALRRLDGLDLVDVGARGTRGGYSLRVAHPLYPELKSIALKALMVGPVLTAALGADGMDAPDAAFIYGSAAAAADTASSDLDVFVIGTAPRERILLALADTEDLLGRPISVMQRTRDEVERGLAERRSFYVDVWSKPRIVLCGGGLLDTLAVPSAAA